MMRSIENVSLNLASKVGFDYVPWFTLTKIVLAIYTVLTIFVLFYRQDFINLTVCVIGIHMMLDPSKVKRWTFRMLVLGIVFTLIFDLIFFFTQEYTADQTDGGVERGVRSFALTISYFSFFFRIIVAIVFWKDSLDFNRIIKQQNDRVEPRGGLGSPNKMKAPNYKKNADKAIDEIKKRLL